MPKKDTTKKEAPAKKEFAWDTTQRLGEFGTHERKTEVFINTLNGKTFVSAQQYVWSKKNEDWKRTKNHTMEMSIFKEVQHFISEWELHEAFGNADEAIQKAVVTGRHQSKTENKSAAPKGGGLKAKKQAAGASTSKRKTKEQ